jgi:hypothetical protein
MERRNDGKPLYVDLDASNIEHQHICCAIAGKDHRQQIQEAVGAGA